MKDCYTIACIAYRLLSVPL